MKLFREFFYFSDVHKLQSRKLKTITTAAALGLGLGLSACSDSTTTAGGGPSGTEAGNAITAQIFNADKTPAAHARVKVIESVSLDSHTAYTAEADKNGQVTVEGVPNGNYILEAKQGANALQMNILVHDEALDLGASNLEKTVTVSGSVDAEGTIKVRGLDYSAPVVDGKFQLDSLPAGHLDLVFIPKAADADTASSYILVDAGKKATASTFANESKSLLLDDFEDGDNQHRFGPMYFGPSDGGWWYISAAANVIIQNGVDQRGFIKIDKDGENRVLHATLDFDTYSDSTFFDENDNKVYAWGSLGVGLGSNDKSICYDLSSVDSVAFMAKGEGFFKFVLVDESHKEDSSSDGIFAESEYRLSEDWQRISIPLAEITDINRGNVNCVTLLSWSFGATTDIWLDNVELVGGDKSLIWEK